VGAPASELAEARRGLVAPFDPPRVSDADGHVVWELESYDFLEAEPPATANPNLWYQAQLGCIAGLLQRHTSGKGCIVDASLFETALGLLSVHFARYQASGRLPERHPTGSLGVVIFEGFATADGQVIVAAANDRLFAKLATELGHAEWISDPRYNTNAARIANKETLIAAVADILRQNTSQEWVERLEKIGVPCAPINDMSVMRAHPQTAALNMLQPVPDLDLTLMALPLSFDGERPLIRTRAPRLGQHNGILPDMPVQKK